MNARFVRCSLAVAALAVLAACESATGPTPELRITPDETAYVSGSMATITVQNLGDEVLFYNLCPTIIERREGFAWISLNYESLKLCNAALFQLQPGESVSEQVELPTVSGSGTYRVVFPYISTSNSNPKEIPRERKASEPFTLAGVASRWIDVDPRVRRLHPVIGAAALLLAGVQVFLGLQMTRW